MCLPDHRMLNRNVTGSVVAVSGWGKTENGNSFIMIFIANENKSKYQIKT